MALAPSNSRSSKDAEAKAWEDRKKLASKTCDASARRDIAMISSLIEQGLPAGLADPEGFTPLMRAAQVGCSDAIRLLLPVSDPRARNQKGETALMLACFKIGTAALQELFPVSDWTQTDSEGLHALTRAVSQKSTAAVHFLLESGANPLALDGKGRTALGLCAADRIGSRSQNRKFIADMLARTDSRELAALEDAGHSPLIIAAAAGNTEAVRLLLPFCRIDAVDAKQLNALDHALAAVEPQTVETLLPLAAQTMRARAVARELKRIHKNFANLCSQAQREEAAARVGDRGWLSLDILTALAPSELAGCETLIADIFAVGGPARMPRHAARLEAATISDAIGLFAVDASPSANPDPDAGAPRKSNRRL